MNLKFRLWTEFSWHLFLFHVYNFDILNLLIFPLIFFKIRCFWVYFQHFLIISFNINVFLQVEYLFHKKDMILVKAYSLLKLNFEPKYFLFLWSPLKFYFWLFLRKKINYQNSLIHIQLWGNFLITVISSFLA